MIYKTDKTHIEIDDSGYSDTKKLGVSQKKQAKMLQILTSRLYKDSISSIVREISSNMIDAQMDAKNVDEPSIITIADDDGGKYIEFRDFGTGMSKEIVEGTYMELLESTKENNEEAIGFWGLGSKSPLSYRNDYILITIQNNIELTYLVYKDETGELSYDLLTEEETDEKPGTKVKVYFNENENNYDIKTEDYKFAQACLKELSFFENIVLNFKYYIRGLDHGLYNNDKILEGNSFKLKKDTQYNNEFHIILGRVCYPIDWKVIGMDRINIPIGIKFKIGELNVIPSREDVVYSNEAKELIKERILLAKKELINEYNKRNLPIDDIFVYAAKKLDFEQRGKYNLLIQLEETTFNIDITNISHDYIKEENENENGYKKIEVFNLNSLIFAPIQHLPIKLQRQVDPFFFLYLDGKKILEGKERKNTDSIWSIIRENQDIKIIKVDSIPESKEFKKYVQDCYFLREKRIGYHQKSDLNRFLENLGIEKETTDFFGKDKQSYRLGISKLIIEYKRIIKEEVKKSLKYLELSDIYISEEWRKEQKLIAKQERKGKVERLEGIINVQDISKGISYDLNLKTLNEFTGYIVYGFRKSKTYIGDTENLKKIDELLIEQKLLLRLKGQKTYITEPIKIEGAYYNSIFLKNHINPTICRIYQISRENLKSIANKGFKIYHISEFMNIPAIRRYYTALKIIVNKNAIRYKQGEIKLFNEEVASSIKRVGEYYVKNNLRQEEVMRALLEEYDAKIEICPIIQSELNKIDKYFEGLDLLKYVQIHQESVPHLVEFLKFKKKRVNLSFYQEGRGIELSNTEEYKVPSVGLIPFEYKDLRNYNRNQSFIDPNTKNMIVENKEDITSVILDEGRFDERVGEEDIDENLEDDLQDDVCEIDHQAESEENNV